jgi:hypothetical protein
MIREINIIVSPDGTQAITIARLGTGKLQVLPAVEVLQQAIATILAEAKKEIPQTTVIKKY